MGTRVTNRPGLREQAVWSHLGPVGCRVRLEPSLKLRCHILWRNNVLLLLGGWRIYRFDFSHCLNLSGGADRAGNRGSLRRRVPGAWSISHLAHAFPIILLAERSDGDMPDRRFEPDQRMGTVMTKGWNSLAIGTEVGIMTHGTLVACTSNVLLVGLASADRAITIYPKVDFLASVEVCNLFKQCSESVPWMNVRSTENAGRAVVEVWAAQAFVSDTKDML
jgi:hypothetical protein